MNPVVVQTRQLYKSYRIGEYSGDTMLREMIVRAVKRIVRREGEKNNGNLVWALSDVSFDVLQGEVLGIVGRNGAGKSTLLKLLSRITFPTSGAVRVKGSVSSLLEVGTGFHEELTGRENIYLNGSILGMRKREIEHRIDQIIDFSGVEEFIDTPIKRYSSGMRLRLGFAVAAHLASDILLVDEVLAVGDAEFQKKCLNAMDGLRTSGRTVLFVSHNLAAVENLCSRCIWIEAGRIRADGDARGVVSEYMRTFAQSSSGVMKLEEVPSRSGNGEGRFTSFEFLNEAGETVNYIRSGDRVTMRLHYQSYKRLQNLEVGITIHTEYGTLVAASNNWLTGDRMPDSHPGKGCADFEIDCLYLLPGRYYLSLYLGRWGNFYDVLKNCVSFDVEPSDYYGSGKGIDRRFGLMFFPSRWRIRAPQDPGHKVDR